MLKQYANDQTCNPLRGKNADGLLRCAQAGAQSAMHGSPMSGCIRMFAGEEQRLLDRLGHRV